MRRITRNLLLGILAVVVLLLALGALPGLVRWGEPYYLTATPAATDAAIDVTELPERRYPYTTDALERATADAPGQSEPYWRGPVGIKGAFTHSPFDEVNALAARERNATEGDAVFVSHEGATYRLAVLQEGEA